MCLRHYVPWLKKNRDHADIHPKAPNHQPIVERLRARTVVDEATGCWNLTYASTRPSASIRFNGRQMPPHRLAYEALVGPIPKGLRIDHMCENGVCWKPLHLEPVTHRINVLRGKGHPARRHLETTPCVCWDRLAESCPIHGRLHWRDDWRDCIADLAAGGLLELANG